MLIRNIVIVYSMQKRDTFLRAPIMIHSTINGSQQCGVVHYILYNNNVYNI